MDVGGRKVHLWDKIWYACGYAHAPYHDHDHDARDVRGVHDVHDRARDLEKGCRILASSGGRNWPSGRTRDQARQHTVDRVGVQEHTPRVADRNMIVRSRQDLGRSTHRHPRTGLPDQNSRTQLGNRHWEFGGGFVHAHARSCSQRHGNGSQSQIWKTWNLYSSRTHSCWLSPPGNLRHSDSLSFVSCSSDAPSPVLGQTCRLDQNGQRLQQVKCAWKAMAGSPAIDDVATSGTEMWEIGSTRSLWPSATLSMSSRRTGFFSTSINAVAGVYASRSTSILRT